MSEEQSGVLAEETVELDEITVDDVLVEEVSIDGMCGVY
jgi:mycofactocin precursor